MTAEKDAAIKEWTRQLREEFSTQEVKFKEDLNQATNQFEEAKRHQVTQETAWQMKCNLLIEQNKKTQVGSPLGFTLKMIKLKQILKASNSADFEHYQARIRGLEEEITVLKHQAAPAAEAPNLFSSEEVEELKSLLAKKTAEVSFLKDTVRLECEERIQLVTQLASLTKNRGSSGIRGRGSLASTSTPNVKALSASPIPPKAPTTQVPLDGDGQ